ncbi:MAG TPA: EAL domain-containing protein [Rubrivivax sp.]|nr:EAL domain-containing protein [Rubrivivax sp.]
MTPRAVMSAIDTHLVLKGPREDAISGQRRVRLAMYLAFLTLAVAMLTQGWNALRLEALRAVDAEITNRASLQGTFSQQIGRMAALIELSIGDEAQRARNAEALSAMLVQQGADALTLNELLKRQLAQTGAARSKLHLALEIWEQQRERLWYRTELLLRHADAGAEEDIRASAAAVQGETGPALVAAQQLSNLLRAAADERAVGLRQQFQLGGVALLALLLLLAIVAVEPTARSVQRHARRLAEQATELQRLAMVAEHTSALVIISDLQHRVQWVNQAFIKHTGFTLQDIRGRRPCDVLPSPRADAQVLARVVNALEEGRGIREEWLNQTKDGRELWLDVDLRPLTDEHGEVCGFVSVSSDVTARVQQQGKLQTLWAVLPAGVMVHSASGRLVEINRAGEKLLGVKLAQLQGREPMAHGLHVLREDGSPCPKAQYPSLRALASGQPLHNETLGIQLPSGEIRWLLINAEPQFDHGQVVGAITCMIDITERRLLQERLSDSALTDALTRLPNRTVVMQRLQQAIDHASRHPAYGFAVLFMDFDRFKQVNDTLGHEAGDELLRQIAQRLVQTLRPGDALARLGQDTEVGDFSGQGGQVAARLGGDEFVVVLDGVSDAQTAGQIAQRLLEELAEPYLIGCNPVHSSASIGVVLCTDMAATSEESPRERSEVLTAEDVLRNADTAMYEAKRAGRGRWVLFDNSMHERVVRALAVENDLRQALKDDELFVVYQPVVDLPSEAMVGVEALVRWRHPLRGLVAPVEFIGVAEECGLIDAVGSVVLRKACTQFMQWQRTMGSAAPRQLAVNLSRAQLERVGLVDEVRDVLHDLNMPAQMLQLEVTESLAAQDERVQTTLRELKKLGVRLALDDFGTGYSSLACLHQMPVDTVKVDRSFVKHAETVEYHRVLIEATIRVARTLGMTTVAEGIETRGQAELMRELECDRGQGYLFSRPLDAPDLERWARAHTARGEAEAA